VQANRLAQAAALASLEDPGFAEQVVANNRAGKQAWYGLLDSLGLAYVPTQANFIFFDTGLDSREVAKSFLERGLIVRAGADFGAPTWLRVTIGTEQDNARARAALKEIVQAGAQPAR